MTELEKAQQALADYEARKRRQLDAMLAGMPAVGRYVQQNAPAWEQRRKQG